MRPSEPPAADLPYVRFPPRWHNVLVPSAPSVAATTGMSLYTASKPIPVLLQQTLWAAARVSGARLLPGRRELWTPPIDATQWAQLWRQWAALVDAPIDGIAIYERLQAERAGLTMLLCAGAGSVLVRVRRDPATLAREQAMSAAAQQRGTSGFRVPRLAGAGALDEWHWVAYAAIAARPHLPRYRVSTAVLTQITDLVEGAVAKPAGTPEHWRGAHGDLVPWNLRRSGGATWLIDWEDAGWAPPGTDKVYLAAVVRAMRPGPARPMTIEDEYDEARARLLRIVDERPTSQREQRLRTRLIRLLGG